MALVTNDKPQRNSGSTESPFVFFVNGSYYISICAADSSSARYLETRVHKAVDPNSPLKFATAPIGTYSSHAAEWVQHDGRWWMTSAGWEQGGVYASPMTPAAVVPSVRATPIGTWAELAAAVNAAAGETVTLTLLPSFTMAGYVSDKSFIYMTTDGTVVTIEGHGATFDAAGKGSLFYLYGSAKLSLTVRNVTMQNAYSPGGAIEVNSGSLTLDACTLVNNTCSGAGYGGALIFFGEATGLITGCKFVGPISAQHNDIYNFGGKGKVTFACAESKVGTPVQAQNGDITVIPPKELQCTVANCFCRDSKCVIDPTATLPCAKCQTPGACV
jgi:hypothetical protein